MVGIVGFETDRDFWRQPESTPLPIFIELENYKLPFPSVANGATNYFYPVRILRKMIVYQRLDLLFLCGHGVHSGDGMWEPVPKVLSV